MVNHPPIFSAKFGVAGDISWVSPSFCGKICRYIGCTGEKNTFLSIDYSLALKDLGIYFAILWTLPRYLYPSMTLDFVTEIPSGFFSRCFFLCWVASKKWASLKIQGSPQKRNPENHLPTKPTNPWLWAKVLGSTSQRRGAWNIQNMFEKGKCHPKIWWRKSSKMLVENPGVVFPVLLDVCCCCSGMVLGCMSFYMFSVKIDERFEALFFLKSWFFLGDVARDVFLFNLISWKVRDERDST